MATRALIGLGSNLGDRRAILDAAVAALRHTPGLSLLGVSTYHETAPVGGPAGQGPFLNAAAAVSSTIGPHELHARLRAIEAEAGRVRRVRWGERTLDLDLLLFGDTVDGSPELTLPHPRFAVRRFVLAPLAEVAPDAIDPLTGRTMADLLENLDRRPSYVALCTDGQEPPEHVDPSGPLHPAAIGRKVRSSPGPDSAHSELYRRVAARLDAQDPIPERDWRAWQIQYHAIGLSRTAWEIVLSGSIEDLARTLNPPSPPRPEDADRWLLTDFWLDQFYLRHRRRLVEPRDHDEFRRRFLESRRKALSPTFVAATPKAARELGLHSFTGEHQGPIGRDVPILMLESDDPEAGGEEVLAACAATRTG